MITHLEGDGNGDWPSQFEERSSILNNLLSGLSGVMGTFGHVTYWTTNSKSLRLDQD